MDTSILGQIQIIPKTISEGFILGVAGIGEGWSDLSEKLHDQLEEILVKLLTRKAHEVESVRISNNWHIDRFNKEVNQYDSETGADYVDVVLVSDRVLTQGLNTLGDNIYVTRYLPNDIDAIGINSINNIAIEIEARARLGVQYLGVQCEKVGDVNNVMLKANILLNQGVGELQVIGYKILQDRPVVNKIVRMRETGVWTQETFDNC